jgi:hypothetical protein
VRLWVAITVFAAACVLGCSPGGVSIAGTRCVGDLGSFVVQCITNRGGLTISTNLSPVKVQWTYQFRPNEDIVVVAGDHFSEVRSFLRQACGEPDPNSGSANSVWYRPKEIGVGLNLTGAANQTVICILGRYGDVASPPNALAGANGWQPSSSDTNSMPAAPDIRRSP